MEKKKQLVTRADVQAIIDKMTGTIEAKRPQQESQSESPADLPAEPDDGPVELDDPCPVCDSNAWIQDDDGWYCEKCKQSYGEPAAIDDVPGKPDYDPDPIDDMKAHLKSRIKVLELWVGGSHTRDRDIPSFDEIAKVAGAGASDKRKTVIESLDKAYKAMKDWSKQIH